MELRPLRTLMDLGEVLLMRKGHGGRKKSGAYPWLRAGVILAWMMWLRKNGRDVKEALGRVGLCGDYQFSRHQPLPMWRAFQLMHSMAEAEGVDLPLRIVENDDCFRIIRHELLPGSRSVGNALLAAKNSIVKNFSHVEIQVRLERSSTFRIEGKIHQSWPLDIVHVFSLYLVAVLTRLCEDCLEGNVRVVERVELPRHSRGSAHLRKAKFGQIVERKDRRFVLVVQRRVLGCTYSPTLLVKERKRLQGYERLDNKFYGTFLAVAERWEGEITAESMAANANIAVETLQRKAKRAGIELPDLLGMACRNNIVIRERTPAGERVKRVFPLNPRGPVMQTLLLSVLGDPKRHMAVHNSRRAKPKRG